MRLRLRVRLSRGAPQRRRDPLTKRPTCAVYTRAVAGRALELVAARELRPREFFERVRTRFVPGDELRDVDPVLESFFDCDNQESYHAALRAA